MGKIVGLDHISINVKSMEETLDYYCNLLGFQLLTHEPAPFGDFALIIGAIIIYSLRIPLHILYKQYKIKHCFCMNNIVV